MSIEEIDIHFESTTIATVVPSLRHTRHATEREYSYFRSDWAAQASVQDPSPETGGSSPFPA
jgi:hypothetical protein